MAVWDLLVMSCGMMPIAGAIFESRAAKLGVVGYVGTITVGVVMGLFRAWMIWSVGENVFARVRGYPEWRQNWYYRSLYFTVLLWLLCEAFLVKFTLSAVIRLV
jgi:hypothetical protein